MHATRSCDGFSTAGSGQGSTPGALQSHYRSTHDSGVDNITVTTGFDKWVTAAPQRHRQLGGPATADLTCLSDGAASTGGLNCADNGHQSHHSRSRDRRKADVTTAYFQQHPTEQSLIAMDGVYVPQEDSQLLIEMMTKTALAAGRKVADLCTGSGVIAVSAARHGASSVTAFDICPRAVRCARANALANTVALDVHLGSWARAAEFGPFDLIVCNPPYVPHDPDRKPLPAAVGPARAWNAGRDGRLILDPLCQAAPELLANGGSLLLAQSEFADPAKTLASLSAAGMDADVIARQWIPFGPVLTSRAEWLEETDRLEPGRREEEIMIIRADKP
jgi:release factor glutamine methyltransferase